MDKLERKTFTTSRNLTYTYYQTSLASSQNPTILLQHGFPDDHNEWVKLVPYLLQLPYPIIVPDLLGYGGTSKPLDPALYNSKGMADDLAEILHHEKIAKIVSVGHDWGALIATRMWLWHPELVVGVALLNSSYNPPIQFDLDKSTAATEKRSGLPLLAYWYFLSANDAPRLMLENIEAVWSSLHSGPEDWEGILCHHGVMRQFIEDNRRVPVKPYAQDSALRDDWIARFRKNGFEAPVQWYHAQLNNYHWEVEKELPKERWIISAPFLFIGATSDSIAPPKAIQYSQKAGLLPNLTTELVNCGHWQPLEVPEESASLIAKWLRAQDFHMSSSRL